MRAPQLPHLFLIMAPAWATDQIMRLQLECYQSKDPLELYGPYIAKLLLPSYTTSLRLVILSIVYQFSSHDNGTVARDQDLAAPTKRKGIITTISSAPFGPMPPLLLLMLIMGSWRWS